MKKQSGFSLVELMVALTIGLVLLAGLGSVFVSMQNSYSLQQKMSTTQNNELLAMSFLQFAVRNAGAFQSPLSSSPSILFPAIAASAVNNPLGGAFVASQALTGTGAGGSPGTDTFSVRFVADPNGANQGCSAALTASDVYTDTFSVSGGYLICTETDVTAGVSATVNLIGGVQGLSILYGLDPAGTGSETEYMTASQVSAAGYWPSASLPGIVKTVTATVTFTNPLYVNASSGPFATHPTVTVQQTIPYMAAL